MSVTTLNILLTLATLLVSGPVKGIQTQGGDGSFSCFGEREREREKNKLKYLYHDNEGFNITIRSSDRTESR